MGELLTKIETEMLKYGFSGVVIAILFILLVWCALHNRSVQEKRVDDAKEREREWRQSRGPNYNPPKDRE